MEKKFSFVEHEKEIRKVAEVNGVDIGVAYDMFRADVAFGAAQEFNTGAALPEFDFAAAKEAWDAMSEQEKSGAYHEWHEHRDAQRRKRSRR